MSMPFPEAGFLHLEDDDGVIEVYRVTSEDYNFYEEDGLWWLTVYCRAEEKVLPPEAENPEPWIEINIPFNIPAKVELTPGTKFSSVAYDETFGSNLTNIYWFSHSGLENPVIEIVSMNNTTATLRIRGERFDCPVAACATFALNPERKRSFT